LTSFNQLQANIEHIKDLPFSYVYASAKLIPSVVIADEAHRLKEPRAARTLAIKKMQCTSCFGLTGTLIQNRMEEMWSVLDFVSVLFFRL
jgi:superfamily II DNA or RNA helicase